jgi:hypothetical protein
MSAKIIAEPHEFTVSVRDKWMTLQVERHVALKIAEALRDKIRALTWNDEPDSMRRASTYARMAYALETTSLIQKMSLEDVVDLLKIRNVRSSKIGDTVHLECTNSPIHSSSMNDPVHADVTAKNAEILMKNVLEL